MARRRVALLFALAPTLLATTPARAETPLRANLVEPRTIRLDGLPREWPAALQPLRVHQGPRPGESDLSARYGIAYDATNLYVAFDVDDDDLVRTASCAKTDDHASLLLAFPTEKGGYVSHEIALFPGLPGKLAGCVKNASGATVKGAQIVEAPKGGGYTFEASIPWSTFPEASRTRTGLRALVRFHDHDAKGPSHVVASSRASSPGTLPVLLTEPEQSLKEGLLRKYALSDVPAYEALANLAGDAMNERVLVHDRWLVVLGPRFRQGKEYFFADLGASAAQGQIPRFEVRDLNGDGRAEILVEKHVASGSGHREVVEILGFGAGDRLLPLFRHEIGVKTSEGHVRNEVSLVTEGGKTFIDVQLGSSSGFTASTYREPVERRFDSVLLPWGSVKSRRFGWNGKAFTKLSEVTQTPAQTSIPNAPPTPAQVPASAPRPPTPEELQEKVYALYRRDRGVPNVKPRFDMAIDVAEDSRRERVLLHDRDLVIFGPGYKAGTGYAFVQLGQFANAKDILELQARDLTGDGKAEIIVRGIVRARLEGSDESVEREVFLVYTASGGSIARIFGAETARAIGDKRVTGKLSFVPGPGGTAIQLAPGRATGWDEHSYPFAPDETAVSGIEPLLLPWSGKRAVVFRFDGKAFVK